VVAAPVERLEVHAYTIPTDEPESDGTLEWDSTTIVVVEVHSDGKAGLGFPVKSETPPTPRKAERVSVVAEVTLRRMGKGAYQCRLFDLSPDGCKAEMIERPLVGERAVIRLPGIEPLEAEVRWVEGPNAGLKFERSFHPAVFDLLLARLG